MNASSGFRIALLLASATAMSALSAQAQEPSKKPDGKPVVQQGTGTKAAVGHPPGPGAAAVHQGPVAGRPGPVAGRPGPGGPGPGAGRGPQDARFARGALPARDFGGHPYRGRMDWEGGRWRHEVHNGRDGYWWDVGGVWYYYPQPMDGPPGYISEDFADDIVDAPVAGAYAPPPQAGYYPPPPPPPPADPGASAVGGAIVGGLLGGLLTGRASGAAAGAVVGGATGLAVGATAAARPGYYFSQGNCYYRYPSGQYVLADSRACY
jgi:hypothetical protein